MPIKSKATKAEFVSADRENSIELSARFDNLEKLRDFTNTPPLQFIGTILAPLNVEEGKDADVDGLASNVCSLFFCLQTEKYSYAEIYDAFFGNPTEFFKEHHNILNLMSVVGHIMGEDVSEMIAELDKKLTSPPKKAK